MPHCMAVPVHFSTCCADMWKASQCTSLTGPNLTIACLLNLGPCTSSLGQAPLLLSLSSTRLAKIQNLHKKEAAPVLTAVESQLLARLRQAVGSIRSRTHCWCLGLLKMLLRVSVATTARQQVPYFWPCFCGCALRPASGATLPCWQGGCQLFHCRLCPEVSLAPSESHELRAGRPLVQAPVDWV